MLLKIHFFVLMMTTYCSPAYLNRIASKCLTVGTLTTISLLLGLAPSISRGSSTLVFSSAAYAETLSNSEVYKYATSIMEMEPVRQVAYNKIKQLINPVPPIECSQPNSLNSLPAQAKPIALNYCNQSQKIVESNGLNLVRFNQVTVAMQNDPALKQRIQKAMLCIQNKTPAAQCF